MFVRLDLCCNFSNFFCRDWVSPQVRRSIGSRRNFSTSPPGISKKEVPPSIIFGNSVVTGYAGWIAFLFYKDYKDNPTLWRNFFEFVKNFHHHKKQVPKVKGRGKLLEDESTSRNTQQESLLQEEIETMKTQIQFLMDCNKLLLDKFPDLRPQVSPSNPRASPSFSVKHYSK